MQPLLSLCMIAKNEEAVLDRCLKSVKGLVDEIILVDTGSTDATIEIAKRYTEHVYHFTWINDFAAARNFSISKASGKWILVLDADEYVEENDKQALLEFLVKADSTKPNAFLLPILNFTGSSERMVSGITESSMARLFPRHPDIYYESPIHEQLVYKQGSLKFELFPLRIYHTGYLTEVTKQKKKADRNMGIFNDIKKSNKKLDAYGQFCLAKEYLHAGDNKKALYYYTRAFKSAKPDALWLPHCIDDLMTVWFNLDYLKDAYDLLQKLLPKYPNHVDYYCLMALIYSHFGLYEEAVKNFETCVKIAEAADRNKRSFALVRTDYGYSIPYLRLFEIYHLLGNVQKEVYYLSKLLQMNPNKHQHLLALADILQKHEPSDQVSSYFEKMYPTDDPNSISLLFHTFVLLGNQALSSFYYKKCREKIDILLELELRYWLLHRDQSSFDNVLGQRANELTASSSLVLLLAAVVWQDKQYIEKMIRDSSWDPLVGLIEQYFDGCSLETSEKKDEQALLNFTIELFRIDPNQTYPKWIEKLNNMTVINQLADFFYQNNYRELALDYYSQLLDHNALQTKGFDNAGSYFVQQGDISSGRYLLEQAIERGTRHIPTYTLLLRITEGPEQKCKLREKLFDYYPQYRGIPFLSQM